MKKIAIMQPYFLPYIGYFQLINAVDEFIIYDNIEYTKKGWINRNRYLLNGSDKYFTISLQKDSDYLDVKDRKIANNFNRGSIVNQLNAAYKNAPYFNDIFPVYNRILQIEEQNLFLFLYESLKIILSYLRINKKIIISSAIDIDHSLKGQDKVLEICRNRMADIYINPTGGTGLYDKDVFQNNQIELLFLKTNEFQYNQFGNIFVANLSIIDVLMFNDLNKMEKLLELYTLD